MDEVGVVGEHCVPEVCGVVASQGEGWSETDGVGAALHGIYAISPEPHLHQVSVLNVEGEVGAVTSDVVNMARALKLDPEETGGILHGFQKVL